MAFKCTCLFENEDGPVEGALKDGSFKVFQVDFEVELPFDPESAEPKGSPRKRPCTLVIEKGPQSPLLMKTICEGQNCPKIELNWFTIDNKGNESVYFTTTFENAKLVKMREFMPLTKAEATKDIGHLEEIALVAEKYTWNYLPTGVEFTEELFNPGA
jgi:type VI secretion system secreted protein Hcp